MKKTFLVLLSLLLIFSLSTGIMAASVPVTPVGEKVVFTDDNWAYEKNSGYGYELDEYIGTDAVVELPWSFAKQYITAVGDYAFNDNTTVTSVTTTSKIETIGKYAFNHCTSLARIELFDSLVSLGEGCFYGNTSLTDINLEATSITEVPAYCFAESGIAEIELTQTCTSIGNLAFYNCSQLTKLTIPDNVSFIHDDAFMGCDNLTIYCNSDSCAHQYAVENSIPYVLIDPVSRTFILGDTDGNGDVDVVDATWIQRYSASMDVTPVIDTLMNGDVNDDGEPDVVDATFIMRYVVSIPTPYAIGEWIACDS